MPEMIPTSPMYENQDFPSHLDLGTGDTYHTKTKTSGEIWEHIFNQYFQQGPTTEAGITYREWLKFQGNLSIYDLAMLEPADIKFARQREPTLIQYGTDEDGEPLNLKTMQLLQLTGLIRFIRYMISQNALNNSNDSHSEVDWTKISTNEYRSTLIENLEETSQNVVTRPARIVDHGKSTSSSLLAFKKSIKREVSSYPTLKDEKYFDQFHRSMKITAKSHECLEILNPKYIPNSDQDSLDLFESKQTFMFSVFNANLLTDMGKTIVRKHFSTMNAQLVWKEYLEYMTNSSKGATEKRVLTQYVTSAVYDQSSKGGALSFVLHFNEQFRKLNELCEPDEQFSSSLKLTLLQNAVRQVKELSLVETMDEFKSVFQTEGKTSSLSYETYNHLLTNACIRYDSVRKLQNSTRRNVHYHDHQDYHSDIEIDDSQYGGGIDLTSDEYYKINLTKAKPSYNPSHQQRNKPRNLDVKDKSHQKGIVKKYEGPIFLPPEIYQKIGKEGQDALFEYNKSRYTRPRTERKVNMTEQHSEEESPPSIETETPPTDDHNEILEIDPIMEIVDGNEEGEQHLDLAYKAYNIMRSVNSHVIYTISKHKEITLTSLVDRGANGGLAGNDVRVLSTSTRKCIISGIGNHELQGLPIVVCAAKVNTDKGTIILIMNEYAYYGKGHTVHSSGQIEHYKNLVDDRSVKCGGKQFISTHDGYSMPLTCHDGLMYLHFEGKPTDEELDQFPSVHITSPHTWDPTTLDYTHPSNSSNPIWVPDDNENLDEIYNNSHLGPSSQRAIAQLAILCEDTTPFPTSLQAHKHKIAPDNIDCKALKPYFGWVNEETILKTMEVTTQWGATTNYVPMRKTLKSRNPVLNIPRRHEPVATDTIYSDTPAIGSGVTKAQLFVGKESLVADIYPLLNGAHFIHALEDNIRFRDAMDKVISDGAQNEISKKVQDILRAYCISTWNSKPYHQNQNPAEWRYRTIKQLCNTIMNRVGAPSSTWLLCLMYVCNLLNHTACKSLKWQTPLYMLTGITPDISAMIMFYFYQPVYYATHDQSFPSESDERAAFWVGVAEHVGDAMTHKLLDITTKKIIYRSAVRPKTQTDPNHRFPPFGGEIPSTSGNNTTKSPPIIVRSRLSDEPKGTKQMIEIPPDEIMGRTFLLPPDEEGERLRARVTKQILDKLDKSNQNTPRNINFIVDIGNGKAEEIISYNQILAYLEQARQEDEDIHPNSFQFRDILDHKGPIQPSDTEWKGCPYNLKIEWETGEITWEPLSAIAADDPITCAIYAKKKDLLHTQGWRRFRSMVKNHKILTRQIKQTKIRQAKRSNKYMFGFLIPNNYEQALQLDKHNGNSKWYDATKLEVDQISEYQVFRKGDKAIFDHKGKITNIPQEYKKIRVHLIYAVKHDGRHKARLVADGHLTPDPVDSIYSGVVSLKNLRITMFLAVLNKQELWGADVGNAYLEAKTKEKLVIVAGSEFGELKGHILYFDKALYGLKSSGKMWAEKFKDILLDMGFYPTKADPCIYMRKSESKSYYEYIAVYVDDLCIVAKNPQEIIKTLKEKFKLKLKGVGPLEFHLGCDYGKDPDGTLFSQPKKYIERLKEAYKRFFNEDPPKGLKSPLDKLDHPELDTSEIMTDEGSTIYMSLIGQLQWLVTLGRFDINPHISTMARFRAAPRKGHLERLKRICGYIFRTKHYAIRFRPDKPDYTFIPNIEYEWEKSVYGEVKEITPEDAPEPLGEEVTHTTIVDANLYHCKVTGKSITGILHLLNKTPTDWYSKLQPTVETATYGSEFIAAKTATEQIIDMRLTLKYLGVPLKSKTYMFGDNKSVVTSATIPHSVISKRHNMLSYHRVREAIAAKIIIFVWIKTHHNIADILSKFWEHASVYPMIQLILEKMGIIDIFKAEAIVDSS